jgi:hypothetical protein
MVTDVFDITIWHADFSASNPYEAPTQKLERTPILHSSLPTDDSGCIQHRWPATGQHVSDESEALQESHIGVFPRWQKSGFLYNLVMRATASQRRIGWQARRQIITGRYPKRPVHISWYICPLLEPSPLALVWSRTAGLRDPQPSKVNDAPTLCAVALRFCVSNDAPRPSVLPVPSLTLYARAAMPRSLILAWRRISRRCELMGQVQTLANELGSSLYLVAISRPTFEFWVESQVAFAPASTSVLTL